MAEKDPGDFTPPGAHELFEREISPIEIYYLLERWSSLSVWNVFDLNNPSGGKELPGGGKHFNIIDRGSCLVATPKDLFAHNRTLVDALDAARAAMREARKRDWTVELSGFNKMVSCAWVEAQLLGTKVLRYQPSEQDQMNYANELAARAGAALTPGVRPGAAPGGVAGSEGEAEDDQKGG